MALLKAVRVSDVPTLDVVVAPDIDVGAAAATAKQQRGAGGAGRFAVIGHRGKGMNALSSPDRRLQEVKENSVRSFNEAARFPVDYVEFDVQVTKDACPIIFHDNFIYTQEQGKVSDKRVTDLQLEEFLQYGPQNEEGKSGKPLLRKMKDGRIVNWDVQSDDPLCTQEDELSRILHAILKVVFEYAKDRPIIFSSFQPDAAQLMRKPYDIQVYFLTNGGTEIYADVRRNSLEEAVKLCLASGMQGIVSEARAIFRFPAAIPKIKEADLSLLTYGTLNNVPEAVYMQHLMGVNGVIVDLVPEITKAISDLIAEPKADMEIVDDLSSKALKDATSTPNFTRREIS